MEIKINIDEAKIIELARTTSVDELPRAIYYQVKREAQEQAVNEIKSKLIEKPYYGDKERLYSEVSNALFNLHGEPEVIKDWVKHKNLNQFFTKYDKINHIDEKGKETLLFLDRFASCKTVADRQERQLREMGHDVSVGVGYAVETRK